MNILHAFLSTILLLFLTTLPTTTASASASMDVINDNKTSFRDHSLRRRNKQTYDLEPKSAMVETTHMGTEMKLKEGHGYDDVKKSVSDAGTRMSRNTDADTVGSEGLDEGGEETKKKLEQRRSLMTAHELFVTPIGQWNGEQWVFFLFLLFAASIILRCMRHIHCCGCDLLDCLACWCCYEMFCDPDPSYALC